MNPLYFFSDRYLPLSLYLLFQEQIDKHIPDWVKQKYRELQDETEDKSTEEIES
ncbi:hypothetical protein ACFQ88_13790 [Paenibacillus sp. NPDC056579]